MTTTQIHPADVRVVPEWELQDRLRRSLREVNLDVNQVADLMGVRQETVSRWTHGHNKPSKAVLMIWSDMTGVDLDWLITGEVRHQGLEPRTRCYGLNASDQRVLTLAWSVKPRLTPKLRPVSRRPGHLKAVS